MLQMSDFMNRFLQPALTTLVLTAMMAAAAVAQSPIVNPGAPGQASREFSAEEATRLAGTRYTQADVRFMQDMIPHHHQALVMSRLVAERTNRNELIEVAERIETSQADEIEFMKNWLAERGEAVPDPAAHDAMHMSREMAGMASPAQMAELEAAEGAEFDKLFLTLMIEHHEGALTMVEDLLDEPGAAYEPVLFEFTTDITSDQSAEIERMTEMLAGYSADPRVGLAAGLREAESAAMNLELLAALPKPDGFFDPENPAGLPLEQLMAGAEGEEAGTEDGADEQAPEKEDVDEEVERDERDEDEDDDYRSPPLSFANTDMAFDGDVLVAGNYHGFNIYDIGERGAPELISSVVCPGGQGDVSIVGDLLIMSVEQTRARLDCGLEGTRGDVDPDRMLGLRIFDISNLEMPVQVGAVQTCRGSHTHSVVSSDDERIIVYNSGLRGVREEEELPGCIDDLPGDPRTALFRIDIVEIPVDDPAAARIVASPAVFADPETGTLAGLWRGGDHGDETQETNETDHCHDITVFPKKNIAAGACSGNGILFDISDPMNPTRIDEVVDESFAYWHSATFNNDGTKVIFTDEWGGGSRPRCRASDPMTWGADAIFDIVDGQLEFRGYYKIPAPQTEEENCVAHNGSIVPVPGRDIFVQAWYQGGVSVVDFTDSANPEEIAFFDRGPVFEEELVMGGYWSTYWFDGLIYGTEIARGLDVLALAPSDELSDNEIAAASATVGGELFNPQQQFAITWKHEPVVARAYIDQLERADAIDASRISALSAALEGAEAQLQAGTADPSLADELTNIGAALADEGAGLEGADRRRLAGLGETLAGIAERLR